MTAIYGGFNLLADQGRLSEMGRNFRPGSGGVSFGQMLTFVLVLVGVGVVIWMLGRFANSRDRRGYYDAAALFRELCRAHGLDFRSRRLLSRVARRQRLDPPARVFLEPQCFEAASCDSELAPHREQLERLRDRLLGAKKTAETNSTDESYAS
jgi:hypothetical protein